MTKKKPIQPKAEPKHKFSAAQCETLLITSPDDKQLSLVACIMLAGMCFLIMSAAVDVLITAYLIPLIAG